MHDAIGSLLQQTCCVADWHTLATSHNLPACINKKIWPIQFSNRPDFIVLVWTMKDTRFSKSLDQRTLTTKGFNLRGKTPDLQKNGIVYSELSKSVDIVH